MFIVSKRMEISASHQLNLDYDSPCSRLHGHNWIITVWCRSRELDQNGMVVDFKHVKDRIHGFLDHEFLNLKLEFNTTAENIAHWVVQQIPKAFKCEVRESSGNLAIYEVDE